MSKFHTRLITWIGVGLLLIVAMMGLTFPLVAQDNTFVTNTPARGFPTNTPQATQAVPTAPMMVTNTVEPSPTPIGPAAGYSNYALRLWLERDVLDVLLEQIVQIDANDTDSQRTVELTQYELEFRFPGAPRNIEDRATLVRAMIDAPLGTVDMQSVVRPYIEHAINNDLVADDEFEGFTVEIMPANLDAGNINDAVIHIVYPDPLFDAIRYEDYVLALGDTNGGYRLVPSAFDAPIVPYNGVQSIIMERLADVNQDGVDEIALVVDDGDLNKQLYILGYRGGRSVDLTRAGETLRFGELVEWNTRNDGVAAPIVTKLYQLASDKWYCISELEVTWQYGDNFYRPAVPLNAGFDNQNTFGCKMTEAEPLFAMSPVSATQLITDELVNFGNDVVRTDRAVMTLAMLYALDRQVDLARETALASQAISPDVDSWIGLQSDLFLEMLNEPDSNAFDICVALAEAEHGEVGACDVQAVLGRIFADATFPDDTSIITQLERIGLNIVQSVVISEVGRADRIAIDFGIESAGWWAFVANNGEYTASSIDTPMGFETTESAPDFITVPQTVYAALLTDNDPAGVLNIIETIRVANPDVPFSEAFRFIEALSNDVLGNREVARATYYDVWDDFPESIWGQLAGRHLELR